MKRLLFSCILIASLQFAKAQETLIKTNRPDIAFTVLYEFIYDSHNLRTTESLEFIISGLGEIKFLSKDEMLLFKKDFLGRCTVMDIETGLKGHSIKKFRIFINDKANVSDYVLRHVMYHELGHAFGLEHNSEVEAKKDKFLIMNAKCPVIKMYMKEPSEEEWFIYRKKFWQKVNATNPKDWWFNLQNRRYSDGYSCFDL